MIASGGYARRIEPAPDDPEGVPIIETVTTTVVEQERGMIDTGLTPEEMHEAENISRAYNIPLWACIDAARERKGLSGRDLATEHAATMRSLGLSADYQSNRQARTVQPEALSAEVIHDLARATGIEEKWFTTSPAERDALADDAERLGVPVEVLRNELTRESFQEANTNE